MRRWAVAALLALCETVAVAHRRDEDGFHHGKHHMPHFIEQRVDSPFPKGIGPVRLSPRMKPAISEQPPAEERPQEAPQSMMGNWPDENVGPRMPGGPLAHLVLDVQVKCQDDFQRLCEWQQPLIELGFERMILDLVNEPGAVAPQQQAEGTGEEEAASSAAGVPPGFVVPLGFGSRTADACMRAHLAEVSDDCRKAVADLDASKPPVMPGAVDIDGPIPQGPPDQEPNMLPRGPTFVFPPPFPEVHVPMGQPAVDGDVVMPPEPFHFHAPQPAAQGEEGQQPDMALWPLHPFVPLPLDIPAPPQLPPRMRGGPGSARPRPGMMDGQAGPMQQQPPRPGMGRGFAPFPPRPHMSGPQDGAMQQGQQQYPPAPDAWVRNSEDGDMDDEDEGAGMLAVMVALVMWLGLSILIIAGFVRAEKRRETLLHFWRTVHGNNDLKNAVEQAAGAELPAPPKGCGLRKFMRAVVIALFVVITLHISLHLCHGPPTDGPSDVTPMPDGSGGGADFDDGRPHPALAFMLLVVMVITSAFLVKALFSFCRRTTSTNTATSTTSSSSTPAPTSIQRGGVAYEAVPTMEMGAGTTSYVAFDSPRRQVYVGVPVSAPPPNTHAVPPQSAPGYAMVL